MTDDPPVREDIVSWWTPDGWRRDPEPAILDEKDMFPHELELLLLAGSSEAAALPRLELRRGDFGIYVEVWGYENPVGTFFVAEEHQAAFAVERLPALIQAFGAIELDLPDADETP